MCWVVRRRESMPMAGFPLSEWQVEAFAQQLGAFSKARSAEASGPLIGFLFSCSGGQRTSSRSCIHSATTGEDRSSVVPTGFRSAARAASAALTRT